MPAVDFTFSGASATGGPAPTHVTRLEQERPGGYLLAHGEALFARSLVEPV